MRLVRIGCLLGVGLTGGIRAEEAAGFAISAKENVQVEKEVLDLREKVSTLTRLLEECRQDADRYRIRLESVMRSGGPVTVASGPRDPVAAVAVLDVEPAAGFVALDVGAESGVKPGHVYHVFRGDHWIARVRVRDVRETIAGAVVEKSGLNEAPQAGDRAVLVRNE